MASSCCHCHLLDIQKKRRKEHANGNEAVKCICPRPENSLKLPKVKEKMIKVDNPSITKLVYGTTKPVRRTALPDINQYKHDPFAKNPLLKFHLSAGKSRRVFEFLQERAIRNKIKTYKERSVSPESDEPPQSQLYYMKLMQEYGDSLPTVPIQKEWIQSIQSKLHGLHLTFPHIASSILDEIKDNYQRDMHEFGVSLVVQPLPGQPVRPGPRPQKICDGKTSRYPLYLKRRKFIEARLYILHPLQRSIFQNAVKTLPETLVDFSRYRKLGLTDLENLKDILLVDLQRSENIVTSTFYSQIAGILGKQRALREVPSVHRHRFLASVTNIFKVQVTSLMYRTIDHLLWLTEDDQRMAQHSLELVCEDGLQLLPSQQEIYATYHNILDWIANCASKLTPLETWVDGVTVPEGYIPMTINEPYLKEAHDKLQTNLEKLFQPINDYIQMLEVKHSPLYTKALQAELADYIQEGHSFEELVDRRLQFQEYVDEMSDMISNEFFPFACVCQSELISSLKEMTDDYTSMLHQELFRIHADENKSICDTFEGLKNRAMKEPESTEELMDMGIFMLGASSAVVSQLEERIAVQLTKAAVLINTTEVPVEYINLMSATVNWITNIRPIFEMNSAQYEQHKFEFEERLQKRTEALNRDLDDLGPKLVVLNNMDDTSNIQSYLQEIRKFLNILDNLDKEVLWINHEESLFKFPVSTYPELDDLHSFIAPFAKLLFLTHKWQWKYRVWMHGSFQDLDARDVESATENFYREFNETQKMYKAKIKQQIQDNMARRFKGNVDDPDPNNIPTPIKICAKTLEQIKLFRAHVPVVKILCNNALMQRHWDEMSSICKFDITPDYGTTLSKVVNMEITPFLDSFEIISIGACKELQLGENLKKMWSEWSGVVFTISKWKESNLNILSDLEDVQALLDDHLVKTLTMRGSAFVRPFETEVKDWYAKLDLVNKTIEEWSKVQVQWLYLLPIFSSPDITSQMVEETVMFKDVDSGFRRIMDGVALSPEVLKAAGSPELYKIFQTQLTKLEQVNDGVNNYLEKKRLYFPRFFFLSNDEMLEILSETKNPLRVQPHLRKCFEGIAKLRFDPDFVADAMLSSEGEVTPLESDVVTKEAGGCVEKWLKQVETEMVTSVKDLIRQAFLDYPKCSRTTWIQKWQGQIVICVSSIYWTASVHHELAKNNMRSLKKLDESLQLQLNDTVELVRGELPKLVRITLGALIVIDVHAKAVVEELIAVAAKSDLDFSWLAQLRYYWEEENCLVRMVNATIKYAYEYLGNTPRLVITPLTDRCYRTLIGAYCLHLNGAPEGPAGTGKTETTKDLAKALAVQCIVFNCSDGLNYIAMGKFFKGVASSGAWVCFDEFNRIDLEVLSVVAQQILSIMRAVKAGVDKFLFEGTELQLNPACYVCITMNPGYAGRSELPDNLKVLFRTVAMMVPDYALISEISLYSYGFMTGRPLSIKIVTTYRLCSEQLSVQSHYDYGMRAVKTVLVAAGTLKLKHPNIREDVLLLRALIDVNRSKLLDQDVPLFEGILMDLFPGVEPMLSDYTQLMAALKMVCSRRNLQCVEYFRKKILETYEMMMVRHGWMMVGEPFGAKTCVLHALADCLCEIGEPTEYVTINPKSITIDQLYGKFDPVTYEWSDGVLSVEFRKFATSETLGPKWIIFDGPVDAVWIENLNTVLDDNKKLCLTSGEVMTMSADMRIVFEVMDLKQASPATVSRCGMIYLEPGALGWLPLVESWIKLQDPLWIGETSEMMLELFKWFVPPTLTFLRKSCQYITNSGELNKVTSMLRLITMLMADACTAQPIQFIPWMHASLIFAGLWGLGGSLTYASRTDFNEFYMELWRGNNENYPIPECIGKIEVAMPTEGLLSDYCYAFKGKGYWRHLNDVLKQEKVDEPANLAQMFVPTMDTVKFGYIIDLHVRHNYPFMLVGGTGSGKTFWTKSILMNKIDQNEFAPAFISFTVSTGANYTQDLVISKLNKKKRGIYGPIDGQRCLLFVDDVNMPALDVYGSQPPIELLRQYLSSGYWYDLKDNSKITLVNTMLLAAMGIPGGSRQEITPRFLRHFNIYTVFDANEESMSRIFSAVLFAGLRRNGFATDVLTAVTSIVNATLDLYMAVVAELRPTPSKSHYIFNLRDFSRVIQGCALIRKESVDSRKVFAKLWVHESLRVFYDRLIDASDRLLVHEKIRSCVKEHLKEDLNHIFDNLRLENSVCTETTLRDLMFGSYLDADSLEEDRKYEEVAGMNLLADVATATMAEYNSTHKTKLDIVLFRYALEHLSKICRILSTPGGCGLLVGVSGSGRRSLAKLATVILGFNFFQPEISANYTMNEWRDDIRKILKEAGGRSRSTTFLFSEEQVKDESFLVDIDSLLNLGEIPELFPIDEKQDILEMVRLAAQGGNRNLDISPLAVFNFFIHRCKQKLHMLLCFSPVGEAFRNRLRLYTSLVNCCTIDWFFDWPVEALEMVAVRLMASANLEKNVKTSAVSVAKYIHVTTREVSAKFYEKTLRKTYITTSLFLDLISSFTNLTNKTQETTKAAKSRYLGGLEKLEFASNQVAEMSLELSDLKPKLEIAKKQTVNMMGKIESEKKKVEAIARQVKNDENIANVQAMAAMELKAECESDLAQAIPILEEAIAALNTLKPTDITLVKSMKNPPDAIKLVMAAVCVMKDVKPDRLPDPATGRKVIDFWGPSKRILGDMAFLQSLKDYDKDNIPPEIMLKIRKEYLPHKDFKPNVVAKASSAAEGLCKWIIAMDLYDAVAKEVAPKKAKLEVAEREYSDTMRLLNEKRAEVQLLEEQLGELMQKLQETQERKQKLEDDVTLCSNKLTRAEKLIAGLGGEKSRWEAAADELQANYDAIAGDILLSCGIITYLSPFTHPFRQEIISVWHKKCIELEIPCSAIYSFSKTLGNDVRIQSWHIYGLPRDQFSIDNAIMAKESAKWPLLIDPQGQANKWIKEMEKAENLEIVKISDPSYMKVVINCIEYGKPVLIESVLETLDPALDPVLNRNIYAQAGRYYIAIKDDVIEYNLNFKLFLTSNLRNPHYLPEIFSKVCIINFALTSEGLEDQLLGIVVAKERPDLQNKRQELIIQSAKNRQALADVENMILQTLSTTKGNILEDESAIETLDSSKLLSESIKLEQISARETEQIIDNFRSSYRNIAAHSALLYYCIVDLANLDPMYQYGLTWFINLFVYSISTANKSKILERRLKFLHDTFTYDVYTNVCRSLFEKHRLLFSFILCSHIMIARGKLDRSEYMFFLTGGDDAPNAEPKPSAKWFSEKSWNELCRLSNAIPAFAGISQHFADNHFVWKNLYDASEPTFDDIPAAWRKKLTKFQCLILIRIFRPDKTVSNVNEFVKDELGGKFVTPPAFSLNKTYNDSNCLCPIIFLLSPGSDPITGLTALAEKMSIKLSSVSLGQGQGPFAEKLIAEAQAEGSWVCLQNCHVAGSWIASLESIWEKMNTTNTSLTFRLWLTSYPFDAFPATVLQNSVKTTNEPPTGLQQNILRSFTSEPLSDPEFFEGCPGKNQVFGKLLYGMAFFHAVVQERRKYGPIGWNISYSFDESDFNISIRQLHAFINEQSETPFEALRYLTGECNYGGRVTDFWDRRTLTTILNDFLNEKVVNVPSYTFAQGREFALPRKTGYDDYMNSITNLPQAPSPEVFGLHNNAGISQGIQIAKFLFDGVLDVEGGTVSVSTDSSQRLMEIIDGLRKDMPENFDLEKVREKYPLEYGESMNALFQQETERFNIILNAMRDSLTALELAIQGLVTMTSELENLSNDLQNRKIPAPWLKLSYPTLKPLGSYMNDFYRRIEVLQNWYKFGKPSRFWLPGFFSVHGLLTGVKQNFARKFGVAIDGVTFDFFVMNDDVPSPPKEGAHIFGLFLEGAKWDIVRNHLMELMPKVLSESLPTTWLLPVLKNDLNLRGRYICPLYKTTERKGTLSTTGVSTNYVIEFLLDTKEPPSHWIKRGVALVCQLDD